MSQHTPLHAAHLAAGARMVDFAGWDMPVNYGSQIEEHHAVRSDAGMFDVSHMLALDLTGEGATAYLRTLLANDVAKLGTLGKALYSCMLNDAGGVIDDLIVYYFAANHFRIVVNAGTADKDVAWMRKQIAALGANVTLDARRDLAMIAVQGPNARAKTWHAIPGSEAASVGLKPFFGAELGDMLIARTGYTGEDGFEITLPAANATDTWNALIAAGVAPCGLGARDRQLRSQLALQRRYPQGQLLDLRRGDGVGGVHSLCDSGGGLLGRRRRCNRLRISAQLRLQGFPSLGGQVLEAGRKLARLLELTQVRLHRLQLR